MPHKSEILTERMARLHTQHLWGFAQLLDMMELKARRLVVLRGLPKQTDYKYAESAWHDRELITQNMIEGATNQYAASHSRPGEWGLSPLTIVYFHLEHDASRVLSYYAPQGPKQQEPIYMGTG